MVSNDENRVREPLAYNKEHVMPCIRDFGVTPGYLPTGSLNAITDVKGVCVSCSREIDISTIVDESKQYVS